MAMGVVEVVTRAFLAPRVGWCQRSLAPSLISSEPSRALSWEAIPSMGMEVGRLGAHQRYYQAKLVSWLERRRMDEGRWRSCQNRPHSVGLFYRIDLDI